MAELRTLQPSFTAGELSPALAARVDLAKYGSGLRTALNVFIHPHGGASNRAGLEFIGEVKDSAKKGRLIPFQFNTEQSYELEFGDGYFRVYKDGGLILKAGVPYEVTTPYAHTEVDEIVFAQEADVMYLAHPNHPVQKISRLADDDWQITPVSFSPSIAAPTGLTGSPRYKFRAGNTVGYKLSVSSVSASGAVSAASPPSEIAYQDQHFDGRFIRVTWNPVPGAVKYLIYRDAAIDGVAAETTNTSVDMPTGNFDGDGTGIKTVSDPGAPPVPNAPLLEIAFGRENKYVVAAIDEETGEESLPSTPFTLENELTLLGNKNTLTWNAVPGASAYIVYKDENGQYGYIGRTETTTFTDENIVADLSSGPQSARNPFDSAGNYPRCVTFIEQRLGCASTKNDPQAVWLSQSANYENFGVSEPAKASDAVTFRIRSRQVNEIRSMLALKGLMLLTSGAEWVVSGGSQSDAITPSAIDIENQGYRGSARVQPIVVGNTVLFAQERGGVVRDFSYEFTSDGYSGRDLTILARHLFDGRTIKAWAYSQAPYSIAWVVMSDGALISLTYLREHEVWAWTRHDSAAYAAFEDVSVIAEGDEDVPYFLLRRTINGQPKRYIERLHTRHFEDIKDAFFVDCGLTYDGAPATVITGLDHLNGESVVALADGNVVRNLTVGPVNGGADIGVELPNAAEKVHIGLGMVSALQTLDLDLGQVQGLGTVQGRQKSVSEVTLRVEKTRGIFVGPYDGDRDSRHLVEYKQRSTEAWNEAIAMYTGDISMTPPWDWNRSGSMWVKQFDPLPMTVLAIMPDVTIGR
ncbi:hypothetical protein [Nitratireductor rhodophyticola]|uniref:hypothetical protein n=1 Tax=Nitratireductor rhodophyticola TaxID=2854036 RepID=UPI003BA84C58